MPEVQTLNDLIAYQPGSIVSRTLIDHGVGTVTLFAFAAGQALSEHSAPFDAMVQVVEGEGEFIISGRPYRVAAGQMLVMPADEPHAVKAHESFKMLLTMIRGKQAG